MTIQQTKQISLIDFLNSVGHVPTKKRGYEYLYKSPYRNESIASFSVNENLNCFYDFGTGESGDIIKLAQLITGKPLVSDALKFIESVMQSKSFSSSQYYILLKEIKQEIRKEILIKKVKGLSNKALIQYLSSRGISYETASTYCFEIYYQIGEKRYFAIGFENNSGGYELRNKYSKISFSPKDITLIANGESERLSIFEGFIDFLSFIEINQRNKNDTHFLILNSTANIQKAKTFIERYKTVSLYLDNDDSGKRIANDLTKKYSHCIDNSSLYLGYKDLNDFLINQKTINHS